MASMASSVQPRLQPRRRRGRDRAASQRAPLREEAMTMLAWIGSSLAVAALLLLAAWTLTACRLGHAD